jgi:hypothetical protein
MECRPGALLRLQVRHPHLDRDVYAPDNQKDAPVRTIRVPQLPQRKAMMSRTYHDCITLHRVHCRWRIFLFQHVHEIEFQLVFRQAMISGEPLKETREVLRLEPEIADLAGAR